MLMKTWSIFVQTICLAFGQLLPIIDDKLDKSLKDLLYSRPLCESNDPSDGIIILGAGISGVAAAKMLMRLQSLPGYKYPKCSIGILEANPDRIGGRMWTFSNPDGKQIKDTNHNLPKWKDSRDSSNNLGPEKLVEHLDLGAGWIHDSEANPIYQLAKSLKLRVRHVGGDSSYIGGMSNIALYEQSSYRKANIFVKVYAWYLMDRLVSFMRETARERKTDMSLREFLEWAFLVLNYNEFEKRLVSWHIDIVFGGDFASPLNEQSLTAAAHEVNLKWNRNADVVLPDGYSQIIEYLARNISITMGVQIKHIEYDSSGVSFTSQENQVYRARKAIISVPLSMFLPTTPNHLIFKPPLSAHRLNAYSKFAMGVLEKILLRYKFPFWPKKQYTFGWIPSPELEKRNNVVWSLAINLIYENRPESYGIIQIMVGGDSALFLKKMNKSEVIKELHQLLINTFKPPFPVELPEYFISNWEENPYSRGAYAYKRVGYMENNASNKYEAAIMTEPLGNQIYFAGEHLDTDGNCGTVHGAYLTGIQAAIRLVTDALKINNDNEE